MRKHVMAHVAVSAAFATAFGCAAHIEDEPESTPAEGVARTAEPLSGPGVSVNPPDFSLPQLGYYCNAIWPNGGWTLGSTNPGDINASPCGNLSGASFTRTGVYAANDFNIVEARCAPNYYWFEEGWGHAPFAWIWADVTAQPTGGNCRFDVTVGSEPRDPIVWVPGMTFQTTPLPIPAADPSYTFHPATFGADLETTLMNGSPLPVGLQIAVRDPNGNLVYSKAAGSVTGNSGLSPVAMTTSRRIEVASMSKSITGTAMVAAIEDLNHRPAGTQWLAISLDSSIRPYLPSTWNVPSSIDDISFRMVLRHEAGFCWPGQPYGDSYASVQKMIEAGPAAGKKGVPNYCNGGFALMRILIPYVVDTPTAYRGFESNPALNAQATGVAYRSYVKGRVLARAGVTGVEDFYAGPAPATIYFDKNRNPIPDKVNIPGTAYDERADTLVLTAGSGAWTLSAEEYSRFMSALWQGKIVSHDSLVDMIARAQDNVGIGNFASYLSLPDGTTHIDVNENGGGWDGAPQGIWMTFFNGYTAVLLMNSPWPLANAPYQQMEASFIRALTPSAWTCSPDAYADKNVCNCSCGAWDPDCDIDPNVCGANQTCKKVNGTGVCTF